VLKCCKNDKIRVIIYIYPLFWASSTKTIPDLLLIKLSFLVEQVGWETSAELYEVLTK